MTTTDMPQKVDADSARAVSKKRRRGSATGGLRRAIAPTTLLWFMAGLYGIPVAWFVLSSFKPAGDLFSLPLTVFPDNPTVSGYKEAWASANFAGYFINTTLVCVIATILTVGVSCCTGYALAKYDNRWLKAFFLCILATTMLPAEVMLAPLFLVVRDLGFYNSLSGIILPALLTATGCFMFRQFFLTVPDELIEAARIDGAKELSIFLRIMVPLSRPIALTLAILSFQWRWNDYIWPLLMLNDPDKFTVQIGIQSLVGAQNINWSVLLGGSVISMIPLIVVFLVFQKYVMNADINAGLKD
ncbi:carbohydrate ABC transporter permease [Streptomyces sp. S3(2020)]|uniref:carbohydrate ABC transporter permease n=1 Tax=Streptomyces sp. S3(2020) TaxID=2732044 RepID=UPI001488BB60|nr:carbohydrate ABC transporter permease [Streptomyces sp. S3(2020)]NNN30842.1 carbohydrate ABC transporter permease [Streptomyces sp. S3(2020)]